MESNSVVAGLGVAKHKISVRTAKPESSLSIPLAPSAGVNAKLGEMSYMISTFGLLSMRNLVVASIGID